MGYLDETGLSRVWNRIKAYIQSLNYTSNIGTVTGITMNNTSYSPVNGDVDIGTVLTEHQSLTNYVQKNNTSGLLKNDGTVDTNTYLTTETEPAYT
jgi:hypothetical protein